MFFEDEKDLIDSNSELQIDEDGTVTWADVLDSADEDDLVSLSDSKPKTKKVSNQNTLADDGFSGELQLVQDDDDDNELNQILSEEKPQPAQAPQQRHMQENSNEKFDTNDNDDEFDIDRALQDAVESQNKSEAKNSYVKPRKTVTKNSSSSAMPILILVLFVILVGAGVYFIINFTKDKNVNQDELSMPTSTQDQLNNMSQEDIEQRAIDSQESVDENSGVDIPVVDESEAGDVQADENAEEKKQVVSVVPTGRPNPFLPLQKYMAVSIPQTKVNYDKVNVPKPPAAFAEKDEALTKLMSISVSGIMYDDVKPSAIITFADNDYFVQKGDKLDDYRVVDIQRNAVTVASGKNLYKASIGEEFKIDKFYGNAGYISPQQGGGRQYYTASEDEYNNQKSNNSNSQLRYVSESDVNIIAK